jgi:hypothetical protein
VKQLARKRIAVAADAITNAASVQIVNYPKTEGVLKLLGVPPNIKAVLLCRFKV